MADQPITSLPTKTASGVASTDKMLGIDSAEGYQILVRDVAKYIMENYNGSTLAGQAQTPKAAIDALNGKLLKRVDAANDLTTLLNGMSDNSSSFVLFGETISALVTNNDYSYTSRAWILKNSAAVADILINTGSGIATHNIYIIRASFSSNAWSYESTKVPNRQEFNSLNSQLGKLRLYRSTTGSDSSTVQTFNVSDLTGDDYPIFLFTAGFSTAYISAMIYVNHGTENNIAYGTISSQSRNITSVAYDVANKKITITLNSSVWRSGALLRLQ